MKEVYSGLPSGVSLHGQHFMYTLHAHDQMRYAEENGKGRGA